LSSSYMAPGNTPQSSPQQPQLNPAAQLKNLSDTLDAAKKTGDNQFLDRAKNDRDALKAKENSLQQAEKENLAKLSKEIDEMVNPKPNDPKKASQQAAQAMQGAGMSKESSEKVGKIMGMVQKVGEMVKKMFDGLKRMIKGMGAKTLGPLFSLLGKEPPQFVVEAMEESATVEKLQEKLGSNNTVSATKNDGLHINKLHGLYNNIPQNAVNRPANFTAFLDMYMDSYAGKVNANVGALTPINDVLGFTLEEFATYTDGDIQANPFTVPPPAQPPPTTNPPQNPSSPPAAAPPPSSSGASTSAGI
jgi:hypothetical protein